MYLILLRNLEFYLKNEVTLKKESKKIFVIFGFIFVLACKGLPKPPEGTIDENTMAKMLADIHLTEAKVSRMNFRGFDSSMVAFQVLEADIYKKYKTDSITYKKSYDFYASNPQYLTLIYEESVKILEQQQKESKKPNQTSKP